MESSLDTVMAANLDTVDWKGSGIPEINLNLIPEGDVEPDVISCFQEDGAVLMKGLFSDWVDTLRAGLERNMESPLNYAFPCDSTPAGAPGKYFDSYCNWLLIPEYFEFVTRSSAASVAGQLMNANEVQFFSRSRVLQRAGYSAGNPVASGSSILLRRRSAIRKPVYCPGFNSRGSCSSICSGFTSMGEIIPSRLLFGWGKFRYRWRGAGCSPRH